MKTFLLFLVDGLAIAGLGAAVYGAWLAWPPLGWITGGLIAFAVATMMARALVGAPTRNGGDG